MTRIARPGLFAASLTLALAACAAGVRPGTAIRPDHDPAAEQRILELEHELAEAGRTNDVNAIERLEAPEYVSTSAGGKVSSRSDDIAAAHAAEITYSAPDVDDQKVRVYGDTAISTFRVRYTYEYQGHTYRREQRYTNTWIRRGATWQLVASHYSTFGDSTHR